MATDTSGGTATAQPDLADRLRRERVASRCSTASSTSCTPTRSSARWPCSSWRSSRSRSSTAGSSRRRTSAWCCSRSRSSRRSALGQTLIILTAGIDLSAGAITVFSSILMANMAVEARRARRPGAHHRPDPRHGDGRDQRPAGHPDQPAPVHRHPGHTVDLLLAELGGLPQRDDPRLGHARDHDRHREQRVPDRRFQPHLGHDHHAACCSRSSATRWAARHGASTSTPPATTSRPPGWPASAPTACCCRCTSSRA